MKCDEYVTKSVKGRSVRRRCQRTALEGVTKCYGHADGEYGYVGDARLGPGNYARIGRILVPPEAEYKELCAARVHVLRVLKGDIRPGWEFAQKLAAAAGVTLDELGAHLLESELKGELREIVKRRKAAA